MLGGPKTTQTTTQSASTDIRECLKIEWMLQWVISSYIKEYSMYCIYKYTSPSGKSYIGQTKTSLAIRAGGADGQNYKKCVVFYNAIQKYGFQNFSVIILEDGLSSDEANRQEQYYIQKHKTLVPYGYNLTIGGENPPDQSKKVCKYNSKKELVEQYDSLTQAAIDNNCSISAISEVCSGRKITLLGHYWAFESETPSFRESKRKKVYQFDEEEFLVMEFESAINADKYHGFAAGTVKQCANKNQRRKRVNGYIFTYEPFVDWSYYKLKYSSTTISGESTPKQAEALCPKKLGEDIV